MATPPLGDRELDVMSVLWELGATVLRLRFPSALAICALTSLGGCWKSPRSYPSPPPIPPASAETMASLRPSGVFLETEVVRKASIRSPAVPAYPASMRKAKIKGDVLLTFVVDTNGFADTITFHVLKATHADFAQVCIAALRHTTFLPAEQPAGRKVRQLVQMPFQFSF